MANATNPSLIARLDGLTDEIRIRTLQLEKDLYRINKKLLPLEAVVETKPGEEPAPQGWFEESIQKCQLIIAALREAQRHVNRLLKEVEAEVIVKKPPEMK